MQLKVGEKVKVHYVHAGSEYILDVEVTAIRAPSEFVGRVESVFSDWGERGEITGGHAFDLLNGRERFLKKMKLYS